VNAITDTVPAFGLQPMEFVGETAKLFPAFVKAQKGMGDLLKTNTNPHFKSKYADLAAVVEAVLPALHANGFGLMQPPHSDGDIVEVETILVHESGGYIRSVLAMRPSKNDPQGVGSAVTYARRYALQSIAGIAPEDDDGNAASGPRPVSKQAEAPKPPTLAERADRLDATLKAIENAPALEKAWRLADGLRKELDEKDPDRLATSTAIYDERLAAFEVRSAA
jgi:hypothetical protein